MSTLIRRWLLCCSITIIIVMLDQVSKHWVLEHFVPYDPYALGRFLNITLAFNTGAAFSFLSGSTMWHWLFFVVFASVMSIVLLVWQWVSLNNNPKISCILSLIIAGAVSNLVDRLQLGQVVDFIDAHYLTYHWPVFNIADIAICLGAFLLMLFWD